MKSFIKALRKSIAFTALTGWLCLSSLGPFSAAQPAAADTMPSPCVGFGVQPITQSPDLPANFGLASQLNADCIAWQQFVYMNWTANTDGSGTPDSNVKWDAFGVDASGMATTWESFQTADDVFSGGAVKSLARTAAQPLVLRQLSKTDALDLGEISQATGQWLTDQRGNLVYYDIRMNPDEVDYVHNAATGTQDLTYAAGQLACASNPGNNGKGGFNLPMGYGGDVDCAGQPATFGHDIGAVEIKAAWAILPADGHLDLRYLTSEATVIDPQTRAPSQHTMGLVGLHIIRRLPGAEQFLWSTFEQIDNAPDSTNGTSNLPGKPNWTPPDGYTFFDPNCDASTNPYKCKPNVGPATPPTPCTSTNPETPAGCFPLTEPMQVVRENPVDSTADAVTEYMWNILPSGSVFQYYRLIDVQWPQNPTTIAPGATAPLSTGDIQPSTNTRIMANVTLETYAQKESCMSCHKFSGIASVPAAQANLGIRQNGLVKGAMLTRRLEAPALDAATAGSTPNYAASYSFIFESKTVK